jgi:hypothetical protein
MNKGTSSSKPGTMGAYKPRRPGMTMADVTTQAQRKQIEDQIAEARRQQATDAAYNAAAKGMKNGGMVKSTPKATPYKCGGMVKGK